MPSTKPKTLLALIFVVALALRLAVVCLHPVTDLPDSKDYDTLAKEILHGQPYQLTNIWRQNVVASRMPGYPIFIAGIYAITGEHPINVLIVQAILGALCVPLAYLLASRVSISTGLIAASFTAIDPLGVSFSATLLSEISFTFVILAMISLMVAVTRHEQWLIPAWFVATLSPLAIYLRAEALLFVLVLPFTVVSLHARHAIISLWPVLSLDPQRKIRVASPDRTVFLLVLVWSFVFALLLPWQVGNHKSLGMSYFHLTSLEGISLYEAVYPQATGGPMQDKIALPPEMFPMNEAQRDAEWNRRAWQFIRDDPMRIARLAIVKFVRTWSPWINAADFQFPILNIALTLWHIPIYALALLGIFRFPIQNQKSKFKNPIFLALLLPIAYFSLVHSLFLGSVRYRVPLMPLVYILAAIGLTSLITKSATPATNSANASAPE